MPPAAPDPTMTTSGSNSRVTAPALWASVFPVWAIWPLWLLFDSPGKLGHRCFCRQRYSKLRNRRLSWPGAVSSRDAAGPLAGGAHETQEISRSADGRFDAGALAGQFAGAAGPETGSHRQCRFAHQDGAGDGGHGV